MQETTLNNGIKMPTVGIGVFTFSPEDAEKSVEAALKAGYRLVDTANAYVNERGTGRGIKNSGVPREEIFVSTKLWPTEYENENAVEETLERLGLDYIDLLFLHQPGGNAAGGYRNIEKAVREGKVKAIGLSNFEDPKHYEKIMEIAEIKPQVMQCECHPYFQQDELRKNILEPNDIKLMCWYPLGHGDKALLEEPIFKQLAEKYGKSVAQIILKWHNQMGFIVIPGSRNPEHIKDNADIFDFELTPEEMTEIAKLNKNQRYYSATDEQLNEYVAWKPDYEKE